MKHTIYITWYDSGCTYRQRAFEYTKKYYGRQFNVVVISIEKGKFKRSAIRNAGAKLCNEDVYVVVDADLIIPHDNILKAIEKTKLFKGIVKPFDVCGYMDYKSTEKFYTLDSLDSITFDDFTYWLPLWDNPSGGCYVMRKESWLEVEGMDEGFIGWGGEDDAFLYKCNALLGETISIEGPAFHLYHPSSRGTNYHNVERLAKIMEKYGVVPSN